MTVLILISEMIKTRLKSPEILIYINKNVGGKKLCQTFEISAFF